VFADISQNRLRQTKSRGRFHGVGLIHRPREFGAVGSNPTDGTKSLYISVYLEEILTHARMFPLKIKK